MPDTLLKVEKDGFEGARLSLNGRTIGHVLPHTTIAGCWDVTVRFGPNVPEGVSDEVTVTVPNHRLALPVARALAVIGREMSYSQLSEFDDGSFFGISVPADGGRICGDVSTERTGFVVAHALAVAVQATTQSAWTLVDIPQYWTREGDDGPYLLDVMDSDCNIVGSVDLVADNWYEIQIDEAGETLSATVSDHKTAIRAARVMPGVLAGHYPAADPGYAHLARQAAAASTWDASRWLTALEDEQGARITIMTDVGSDFEGVAITFEDGPESLAIDTRRARIYAASGGNEASVPADRHLCEEIERHVGASSIELAGSAKAVSV